MGGREAPAEEGKEAGSALKELSFWVFWWRALGLPPAAAAVWRDVRARLELCGARSAPGGVGQGGMPKRQTERQFGPPPGTPSKWRAIARNQYTQLAARVPGEQPVATVAAAAADGAEAEHCVDKENAMALICSADEQLELEKLQCCHPASPSGHCAEVDAACEESTERDPLSIRRKRVEEVRAALCPLRPSVSSATCARACLPAQTFGLQLQNAETERGRRIARLQAVVITLENLLIRPDSSESPVSEDAPSNRRMSAAEGGDAATSTKRRRRLDSETQCRR